MLPALLGVLLFYLLPFLKVVYYSLIKGQYQEKFVWLANYKSVLTNPYFLLACKNTLLLIGICVPFFLLGAMAISLLELHGGAAGRMVGKFSVLPLFLPSISVAAAFALLFEEIPSPLPVYSMFLWKYVGMGVIILSAAFSSVDRKIYEAARMDGADFFSIHFRITIPLCMRPIKFALVLGVVYCFRTFRESYLYYGTNYPPDYSYTLQYYMNNQFLKLNYQTMAAASVLITLILAGFISICEKKRTKL